MRSANAHDEASAVVTDLILSFAFAILNNRCPNETRQGTERLLPLLPMPSMLGDLLLTACRLQKTVRCRAARARALQTRPAANAARVVRTRKEPEATPRRRVTRKELLGHRKPIEPCARLL